MKGYKTKLMLNNGPQQESNNSKIYTAETWLKTKNHKMTLQWRVRNNTILVITLC